MITIKFNNQPIYFTPIHLDNILESLSLQQVIIQEYLNAFSFPSPEDIYNLIQDRDKLVIYYHQNIPDDFDTLDPKHFEIILKCLEQLYIYQRDFPLLQMDYLPEENLTIYTYTEVYEMDFEKFQEATRETYTWDNIPKSLNHPSSNMQIQRYSYITHIATIYHYYKL